MAELSFDVDKKELFRVLVDLLAEFDRVCKENGKVLITLRKSNAHESVIADTRPYTSNHLNIRKSESSSKSGSTLFALAYKTSLCYA